MPSYNGKISRVYLSRRKYDIEKNDELFDRRCMGGADLEKHTAIVPTPE
jgi:hypothetical protein